MSATLRESPELHETSPPQLARRHGVGRIPGIAIPGLPLTAVCYGGPLLAAGRAWIGVRRHPKMTRRLS